MKEIARNRLEKPIILAHGDQLKLSYVEIDGVVRTERQTVVAIVSPYRSIRVDEVVCIEGEIDGRYVTGALLVEDSGLDDLKAEAIANISAIRRVPMLKGSQSNDDPA